MRGKRWCRRLVSDEQLVEDGKRVFKDLKRKMDIGPEDQEDVQQEIYIDLLKARKRFDPTKSSWLHFVWVTATFTVRSYFRDYPRAGVKWLRSEKESSYNVPLDDLVEVPVTHDEHEYLTIIDSVKDFSPIECSIVIMTLAGYLPREIANYLGIGESFIYHRIANLRIKSSPSFSLHHSVTQQLKQAA
jgi:DNA-directed RNA polymerase specialized sigma24 family protein